MAGLTWQRRGAAKRQQALADVHREDVATAHDEYIDAVVWQSKYPWAGRLDYAYDVQSYDCGDTCEMCVPDWRDRRELMAKLAREKPTFTVAERILEQVGLVLQRVA